MPRPSPSEEDIDRASIRIAAITLHPTFAGGVYEFTSDDLSTGGWHEPNILRSSLDGFGVYVPPLGRDSFALRQARCRIMIEDALRHRAPAGH